MVVLNVPLEHLKSSTQTQSSVTQLHAQFFLQELLLWMPCPVIQPSYSIPSKISGL